MIKMYIYLAIVALLIVLIVGFFLFMMLNAHHASGGANSKMMNFGKSRAKLSVGDNKANFSVVAGLKEEKEELDAVGSVDRFRYLILL